MAQKAQEILGAKGAKENFYKALKLIYTVIQICGAPPPPGGKPARQKGGDFKAGGGTPPPPLCQSNNTPVRGTRVVPANFGTVEFGGSSFWWSVKIKFFL